jgi:uncharacterized protein YciI
MDDLPEGVEIETIYLVEVPYTPEAPDRRPALRRRHLARIARLIGEGRVIEAGGCADFSKAVLLIRAADEAEALALIAEDVYTSGGVWHSRPRGLRAGRPRARSARTLSASPVTRNRLLDQVRFRATTSGRKMSDTEPRRAP